MTTPVITVATSADRGRVVDSLVAAFSADPALRFMFPEDYSRHAAVFFGYLFDKRVRRETIWTIGDGAATAIWEPPSGSDTLPDEIDLPADERARMREYDEAVHAALPAGPFWYLGVLGTHPASAGRRWGRAVMAEGLRRAAADGLPAVLETTTPKNVEIYRGAGWEVVCELSAPIPVWVMKQ